MNKDVDFPIVYLCDPSKHTKCNKTICQTDCFHTKYIEFAKDKTPLRFNYIKDIYEEA